MNRRFWIILIIAAAISSIAIFWVEAQQEDSRQQRREHRQQMNAERRAARIKAREERTAEYIRHIDSIVLSHNFIFNPTSMQRQPAGQILIDHRIGGAGHLLRCPQAPGKTTGEGGFSCAQVALVGNHRAGFQNCTQPLANGLGLLRGIGQKFHVISSLF